MADELNIPTHRWYQPRYNISLPNSDFSKQWIFNSGIQKIDAFIGGGSSEDASVVTWNSTTDTYTQTIYLEDASVVTWNSSADTYTQSTYGA